jgi:hypothetical protein
VAVAELDAVAGGVAEAVVVGEALTVDVVDADAPRDSDAVAETVPVAVDVGVCVGETDAEHRSKMLVDGAAVRVTDASVMFAASKMLIVWLMARVSQPRVMPAAVHAAGGVQHPVPPRLRLRNCTDVSTVGVSRSTHQNSPAPDPPEL